jgi:hypothetical protein
VLIYLRYNIFYIIKNKIKQRRKSMRRKSLWKNLMLATALTVVLGTAPVTAFAADVDSTVTETEQTVPEADTTVKDEVSTPEAKAITVDVATSSTTFDGTQDIVITYTINGAPEGLEPYGDIPNFGGVTGVHKEKVSDTVYRCTIPVSVQQKLIERDHPTDGQTYDLYSGYSIDEDFPTVTLTYTTGDNGDNGNGETPEKPENPDNGNGDNNGGDNNGGDNNGQTPENPDNGNGDNNNGGQTPETPDNGNGQTPETPDNGNSNTNNQNNTQNNTNNNQTTAKPTKTSPKTGDATATLPVAGTGLASLGVALATVLRKRK